MKQMSKGLSGWNELQQRGFIGLFCIITPRKTKRDEQGW